MSCKLVKDIKHTCEYNAGGIKEIFLLDVRDFLRYEFKEDKLYNSCLVESIKITASSYLTLDRVNESEFSESNESGIFKQELTTFIRSLDSEKTASLLLTSSNRYLVIFRTTQGKCFAFGSDGGATINFTQITGQLGEVSGYSIRIIKDSIYPLFEIDLDNTQHITKIFNESFNDKFN